MPPGATLGADAPRRSTTGGTFAQALEGPETAPREANVSQAEIAAPQTLQSRKFRWTDKAPKPLSCRAREGRQGLLINGIRRIAPLTDTSASGQIRCNQRASRT